LYHAAGPTSVIDHVIRPNTIFGLQGYLCMLVGQRAPTEWTEQPTRGEWQAYDQYRQMLRNEASQAIGMREALALVNSPQWSWGQPGR
jgi:tryptophan halogenase